MTKDLVVGLDIGTTKICAVVGESSEDGRVEIIGIGTQPSGGLRKGVVVNIENTVASIKKAIEDAELMAGCEITQVYTGIAGGHIKSFNSQGVIAIKGREITSSEVDRVIDAAKAIAIPMDREVIHMLPQEFLVDDQSGIQDPVGMSGVRLEAKVHIVTGAVASAHNLIKCANLAGLDVCDIVLESLASAEAVLSPEEMDLGTVLLDFGGGTVDVAIFIDEAIKHTAVVGLGGNNLTKDIAVGLRTSQADAERIKRKYGSCLSSLIKKGETIEVPSIGGQKPRSLSRQILGEILEPRVEEIFELVNHELVSSNYLNRITSGMVITGGSSLLEGVPELAEQIFNMPVRRGYPVNVGGLVDIINSPMYATAVGLIMFGVEHRPEKKFRIRDQNTFNRVVSRMKKWFKDII
ncbi:MAG: cell division protein FtsA [Deltaproteobacteria bacterium]|nr:cell division protein FtsA [Deltaproteobacteria bacterium]